MIDKYVARALLPLVHNEHFGALLEYVKHRKETLSKVFPYATEVDDIRHLQGAYKELDMLEQLRTYVEQDSRDPE